MTKVGEKVNYSELIELGFKHECINDNVHMEQYGYPYFILTYGYDEDDGCEIPAVTMEWSPVTREVNLYINSNTYRTGISLEEVKELIAMLESE